MFPTIGEYNQAIQTKGGNLFKTLSNLTFIPSRTIPVRIYSFGSGSYAVVFKAKDYYNEFAIRCFISGEQENIDRYREIDNYLKDLNESWITKIRLLEEEINIGGKYYPVVKMDWVEGQILNTYISQIISDNNALSELQVEFVKVSKSLEANQVGHGDIQCGNIIITRDSAGNKIVKLIDYDGMFIPAFINKINLERGRTEFQHPNRTQIQYNEKIDRFSFWVLLCALEALKYDKSLWLEVMQGGFNTLDNLLFIGDDFKYFNDSKLVNRLFALNKPSLSFYLYKLCKFCNSLPSSVEPPFIYDLNTQEADTKVAETFQRNENKEEVEIITNPAGAIVWTSSRQTIGKTPLKIDKKKYLGETLTVGKGTQFKQVTVQQHHNVIDISFSEIINIPADSSFIQNQIPPLNKTSNDSNIATTANEEKNNFTIFIFIISLIAVFFLLFIFLHNDNASSTNTAAVDTIAIRADTFSTTQNQIKQNIDTSKINNSAPYPFAGIILKYNDQLISIDSFPKDLDSIFKSSLTKSFQDLDHDGIPEIITSYWSGGAHCCDVHNIFTYDSDHIYKNVFEFWGGLIISGNELEINFYETIGYFRSSYASSIESIMPSKNFQTVFTLIYSKGKLTNAPNDSYLDQQLLIDLDYLSRRNVPPLDSMNFDDGTRKAYAARIIAYYFNNYMNEKMTYEMFNKYYLADDKNDIWKLILENIESILKNGIPILPI